MRKTYHVVMTLHTASNPEDLINDIRDAIQVDDGAINFDIKCVEERDTNVEHHGGDIDKSTG